MWVVCSSNDSLKTNIGSNYKTKTKNILSIGSK